jgi:hypothetical protein
LARNGNRPWPPQAVIDVGQGRWVKLLGARSSAHMRLRLYELKQLLQISEEVRSRGGLATTG